MTISATTQRSIEANGIHLHIAEQGDGPLVVLCHGFPESWYSWRHQLAALAAAGFRAVAPDMRGYGRSDRPEAMNQYLYFCSISSATWWDCLMRSASSRRSLPDTIGERRSPGMQLCCGPIAFAPSSA